MKRLIFIILLIPFICFGNGINKGKYTPPDTILKYADKVLTVGGTYLRYIPKAASFVPTDIAGCELWLDAGQGITKDGSDYVSAWADQSGNGNDATQGTGSAQPLYVANQLNGEPVIRFEGSTDFMLNPQITITNDVSLFICYKRKTITTWGIPVSNYNSYGFFGCNTNLLYIQKTDATIVTATNIDNTNYEIIEAESYYIGDNYYCYFYKNGNYISHYGIGAGNYGFRQVGGWNSFSIYSDIDIAEIIIYNSALDDTNRGLVENYLNTKYAIY